MQFPSQKKLYRTIAACSLGTILEWYDFSIYAYLAPIISSLFFPQENKTNAIILAYSVFAIGFLVRPIGAIFFGHFGDRIGRKKVLLISIVMMAISTCMIGLLPAWGAIGIAAPILLVFLRIIQGFAISGDVSGAATLVIESTSQKRGLSTSFIWASSGIGMLLSSLVVAILTMLFSQEELSTWAWRIPFFISAITGLIGYYLRKHAFESLHFHLNKTNHQIKNFPFITVIKNFKKEVMISMGLYLLCAINIYLVFVFMPTYVSKNFNIPFDTAMKINSLAMFFLVLFLPIFGYYSDQWGRRPILIVSAIGFMVLSWPLFFLLSQGSLVGLMIAQLTFAVLAAGFNSAVTSAVLEMFPTNVRYSASAIGYNLSYSLFGGTTPIIAIYLISKLHRLSAPSFYLMLGALFALICSIKMRETSAINLG